jgi:replication factor C small subunit
MSKIGDSFIWYKKYAPRTIEDTILPASLKADFADMVAKGDFQNLLFSGSAGIGKTTVAKVICDVLGLDYIFINSSLENGIDVLRTKIQDFASTVSLMGTNKVIILDEADGLGEPIQRALRGFMDEFNVRFIMTCNFPHRIIDPLKDSRVSHYKFDIKKEDRTPMMSAMFERVITILDKEGIEYDEPTIAAFVKAEFPNFRKLLVELQDYSLSGKIDVGIFSKSSEANFSSLIGILQKKQFNEMRQWVSQNIDMDKDKLYVDLYKHAKDFMKPTSIPQLVLTLADYQYKSTFAVNQEINTAAMLTDIMASCEFKND